MNLTDLANRYGSDKGTKAHSQHRYTYIYDLLFGPLRHEPITFAEIGLAIGGPEFRGGSADRYVKSSPSVTMWLEYFSRATIFGFDITDFSHLEQPRFQFIRGDSGSESDLRRFASAARQFDIIIDDGSHASFHQQLALQVLWPAIAPGGLYIIEDLHWQSPQYEKSLPSVPVTAAFLSAFFEDNVYVENRIFGFSDMQALKAEADSIAFFPTLQTALNPTKSMRKLLKSVLRRRPSDTTVCVIRKSFDGSRAELLADSASGGQSAPRQRLENDHQLSARSGSL